jgi:hypothetical protein
VASAFRKVWPTITSPISTLGVQKKLEAILLRPLNRTKVSGLLSNSEAIYDKETETWTNPDCDVVTMNVRQIGSPPVTYAISSAHGG